MAVDLKREALSYMDRRTYRRRILNKSLCDDGKCCWCPPHRWENATRKGRYHNKARKLRRVKPAWRLAYDAGA